MKYSPIDLIRADVSYESWDYGAPSGRPLILERAVYAENAEKLKEYIEQKHGKSSSYVDITPINITLCKGYKDAQGNLYKREDIYSPKLKITVDEGTITQIHQVDIWFSGYDYDESPSHSSYEYFAKKEDADLCVKEHPKGNYHYADSCKLIDVVKENGKFYKITALNSGLENANKIELVNKLHVNMNLSFFGKKAQLEDIPVARSNMGQKCN